MEINYPESIRNAYAEAVKGIKESWFEKPNTFWYEYVISLPKDLQTVYLISVFDAQIINGGFNQYFVNGYGQFAKETIDCLKLINANKTASLLEKAYRKLSKECSSDSDFREKLLNKKIYALYGDSEVNKFLEDLDTDYYKFEDDIANLLGVFLYSKDF